MGWLTEIEKELDHCSGEKGISYLSSCIKRMARVIRELVELVVYTPPFGPVGACPCEKCTAWRNLPPDAKELLIKAKNG